MPIASILKDVYPDNDNFTCRQWLPDKGRWCLLHIEKTKDRPKAARLADKLRRSDPSKLTVEDLEELAEVCYCKRWHRWKDPQNLTRTAKYGLEELRQKHEATSQPQPRHWVPRIEPAVRHRPVTRSMTNAGPNPASSRSYTDSDDEFDDGLPQFAPFKPQINTTERVNELITQKISQRLGPTDRKGGYIYIFSRLQSPGFFKIGFSDHPKRRLRQWEAQCGYQAVLRYKSPYIANARRVEQLVFTELTMSQRRERCMNGRGCGREHREWFEIDIEKACASVIGWSRWIEAQPYAEDGELYATWMEALDFAPRKINRPWQDWVNTYIKKVHWADIWDQYLENWNLLQELVKKAVKDGDGDRRTSLVKGILWPVESGRRKDVNFENIRTFFLNAPRGLDAASDFDILPFLKSERVRWHPDKMQQRYGSLGVGENLLRTITMVSQAMNSLWEERRTLARKAR